MMMDYWRESEKRPILPTALVKKVGKLKRDYVAKADAAQEGTFQLTMNDAAVWLHHLCCPPSCLATF
jgi:hypothetical protein